MARLNWRPFREMAWGHTDNTGTLYHQLESGSCQMENSGQAHYLIVISDSLRGVLSGLSLSMIFRQAWVRILTTGLRKNQAKTRDHFNGLSRRIDTVSGFHHFRSVWNISSPSNRMVYEPRVLSHLNTYNRLIDRTSHQLFFSDFEQ